MKKIIKTLIIVVLFLTVLCSCKQKEYKLIEITGEELLNILNESHDTYAVAIVNPNNQTGKKYLEDLKKLTKEKEVNILYLDKNYVSVDVELFIEMNYEKTAAANTYMIIQDQRIIGNEYYSDIQDFYSKIYTLNTSSDYPEIPNEKKLESLSKGIQNYEEGKIVEAFKYLSQAITSTEAKSYIGRSKYLNLLARWDTVTAVKKDKFFTLNFSIDDQKYYQAYATQKQIKEGTMEYDYDNPVYYKVDSDIIYTSKDNKKFKKTYKIREFHDYKLVIEEIKTKKILIFEKKDW